MSKNAMKSEKIEKELIDKFFLSYYTVTNYIIFINRNFYQITYFKVNSNNKNPSLVKIKRRLIF